MIFKGNFRPLLLDDRALSHKNALILPMHQLGKLKTREKKKRSGFLVFFLVV